MTAPADDNVTPRPFSCMQSAQFLRLSPAAQDHIALAEAEISRLRDGLSEAVLHRDVYKAERDALLACNSHAALQEQNAKLREALEEARAIVRGIAEGKSYCMGDCAVVADERDAALQQVPR